jgi:hypothetical protein
MKRAIATFGIGKCEAMLNIALPSYQAFAKRHGYDLFTATVVENERPPAWYKVPMLQGLLSEYDEVLWLDADTVIVDGREDMQVPPEYWQAVVTQRTDEGEIPNLGVWLVRKAMLPVLKQAWELTEFINHVWWENAAIMALMGYDPYRKPVVKGETTPLLEHTYRLSNDWNATRVDKWAVSPPKIRHVAASEHDVLGSMASWAADAQVWMEE